MSDTRRPYLWLYLLLLVPSLTELLESGQLPQQPRAFITDIAVTIALLVVVIIVQRQSRRIIAEAQARLESRRLLEHADRLATVGQLAAGVAHELASPLQVASGRAQMIATREVAGEEAADSAQIIYEQAKRMSSIIRQLLDTARAPTQKRITADLAEVARDTARYLGGMAKKRAVVLAVEADEALSVRMDVQQIQQAVTNLVMNALQTVAAGGHVTLRVRRELVASPLAPGAAPEDHACISVEDDGPGMSAEVRERIFEPFFTTKDVGQGTGLGLSVTHGLVTQNGGFIQVKTAPGEGATFSVFLPGTG